MRRRQAAIGAVEVAEAQVDRRQGVERRALQDRRRRAPRPSATARSAAARAAGSTSSRSNATAVPMAARARGSSEPRPRASSSSSRWVPSGGLSAMIPGPRMQQLGGPGQGVGRRCRSSPASRAVAAAARHRRRASLPTWRLDAAPAASISTFGRHCGRGCVLGGLLVAALRLAEQPAGEARRRPGPRPARTSRPAGRRGGPTAARRGRRRRHGRSRRARRRTRRTAPAPRRGGCRRAGRAPRPRPSAQAWWRRRTTVSSSGLPSSPSAGAGSRPCGRARTGGSSRAPGGGCARRAR